MDSAFMAKMELLRVLLGFPLPETSGYRCPAYNSTLSPIHSRTGPHTTGKAIDIAISGPSAATLVQFALNQGFAGIGINQHGDWRKRLVHLDMADRPQQIIWTY